MKKAITALTLCGALLCSGILEMTAAPVPAAGESGLKMQQETLDSVLYCGTVQEIVTDEKGDIAELWMNSDQYGAYVMNISSETVWVDGAKQAASNPATLTEGEKLYVFHSPVSTRSLPPHSAAFAIVRNQTEDISCAKYHKVEAVSEENGSVRITTDNGGLYLFADEETKVISYTDGSALEPAKLQAGDYVMAWYGIVALSYPGQAHSDCIMVLDRAEKEDAGLDRPHREGQTGGKLRRGL